jgi:hypothetical protein
MSKRKKKDNYEKSAKEFEAFGCLLATAFIFPIFIFSRILASNTPIKESYSKNTSKFIIDALGLLFLIALLVYWGFCHLFALRLYICWEIDGGIIALLLISFIIGKMRRHESFTISRRDNGNSQSLTYDDVTYNRNTNKFISN